MDERFATTAFERILRGKQVKIGEALTQVPHETLGLSAGCAFFYQSEGVVRTGDVSAMLVGHGPVVVRDDRHVIEGTSLDRDLEALLLR
jgi:hypothetical protein